MASDTKWYVVDKDGESTLCVDKDDAEVNARLGNRAFPGYAPHRAVQLVDAAEVDALKARIAELERELEAVGAGGVQPMRCLPEGWVPCVVTYEGQQPEEVAYGPQRLMDRLKKWLDRYFAMRVSELTPGEPVVRWDSDGWGELLVDSLPALLYTAPPAQTLVEES